MLPIGSVGIGMRAIVSAGAVSCQMGGAGGSGQPSAIVGAMLVLSVGLAWPLALIGAVTLLATLAYVAHPAAAEST